MFALSDTSRLKSSEKVSWKILKPVWDVISDYLVIFLAMVCVLFAGMEVTSGSFECLPAVDCPGISKPITNSSLLSQIKYRNTCEAFYSSQKTNTVKRTDVVTGMETWRQHAKFVNSECSKSAIPNFLAYFWFLLFTQALALTILDNLWFKLPTTASVIENFLTLVMECYDSPCPNFAVTRALWDLPVTKRHAEDKQQDNGNVEEAGFISECNQSYELNILDDIATVSAVKTLYEKVKQLKENIESSHKFIKIWQLYLLQGSLQAIFAFTFCIIDMYYMKDLQETMTCTITQYIPVPHDYFICSHSLAPAFKLGLKYLYLPTLFMSIGIFIFTIGWTILIVATNVCDYDFIRKNLPELVGTKVSDIHPVNEDLGFLLHLLHSYNKLYVVRFAHFLSRSNKKKMQAYILESEWPVSKLKRNSEENGNKLTFEKLAGIPPTIFKLSTQIVTLELIQCGPLEDEDFKGFGKLKSLSKLSVIKCGLKCIPDGILNMVWLEELNLKENSITVIKPSISKLENLISLDLSDNELTSIGISLKHLVNLFEVNLLGNSNLPTSEFKHVLSCKRLSILEPPEHLQIGVGDLKELEQNKFDKIVKRNAKRNYVIPYTPEDAPRINRTDYKKVYKMDTSPKGRVVIFNNLSYARNTYSCRRSSENDVSKLKSLFEEIGFDTISRTDCTSEEAKKLLAEAANDTTYKECGCIAVIIMCHGTEEDLVFSDGKEFPVNELVRIVQKSPLYQGKPKLFFVQTFRGPKIVARHSVANYEHVRKKCNNLAVPTDRSTMRSISSENHTNAWMLPDAKSKDTNGVSQTNVMIATPVLPEGNDILLSFSTLPGYSALHNTKLGSRYVHALVDTFSKHAWEEDVLNLLIIVNYEVARAYTSTGWRQLPAPQSTLTKKLYLLPGYPSQCKKTEHTAV